ncbi:MAG: FK506 binding protein proline rotamase rapamycin-binding protein [Trizodia sp. TS-e1964]|nr:MAG: FK506 binding protein proline rotamase rapamycin-binding protein [Trizodia sp. TS-e1964]
MGVSKTVLKHGNGFDKPKKGDDVTIEYTGWLYDPNAYEFKGKTFDTSVNRGDFVTKIGEGKVIRGWDEGVIEMTLGEKATLTISSDYAYGDRYENGLFSRVPPTFGTGFPGHIPPGSALVFDVELKAINNKPAEN